MVFAKLLAALLLSVAIVQAAKPVVIPFERKIAKRAGKSTANAGTRSLSANSVGLYDGQSLFFAEISVGTPPQRFLVQLDTGSSTLFIPKDTCEECGVHADNAYNPSLSSTYDPISCSSPDCTAQCSSGSCWPVNEYNFVDDDVYESIEDRICSSSYSCCSYLYPQMCGSYANYGDGSGAEGYLALETISIGGLSGTATFTVTMREVGGNGQGQFEPPEVDGILGLAFSSLNCNPTCTTPVLRSILEANYLPNQFAMYMTPTGGAFILGGNDEDYYDSSSLTYTNLLQDSSGEYQYYTVKMTDFTVGGGSVFLSESSLNDGTVKVDSGTTLMMLEDQLYNAFISQLQFICDYGYAVPGLCTASYTTVDDSESIVNGNCVALSSDQFDLYPDVVLTFDGGASVTVTPTMYLGGYAVPASTVGCQDGEYSLLITSS
mmetsp:Transcript_37447/g.96734  ORF Transcript_37447/g.96734 Transcript_37447/m.96734 type:complete len:434 (+) Transcript_37447:57-1358(+)